MPIRKKPRLSRKTIKAKVRGRKVEKLVQVLFADTTKPSPTTGLGFTGLITEKSPCCGAGVYFTAGGLRSKRCAKCHKPVSERRIA